MRARVGLKGTLQLLQFKVGLLGDLRHRRRGIVSHLNVVVKLSRLQLRQVRVGLLGKHGEHYAAPVCRIVDDERLLERDHARIGFTVVH